MEVRIPESITVAVPVLLAEIFHHTLDLCDIFTCFPEIGVVEFPDRLFPVFAHVPADHNVFYLRIIAMKPKIGFGILVVKIQPFDLETGRMNPVPIGNTI